jgi:hypothetical protein
MTVNRGPGVAPIAGVGTTTVEHRLQLAGLYAENAPGVPRSGVLAQAADQLVVGRSDMSYDVGPAALVISRTAAEGVYTPTLTGTTNVPTGAAPGTNSRWDLIYVKQNDQAKGDADNAPVIGVQQGAAAASPTKPAGSLPAGAYVIAEARIFALTTGTSGGSNTIAQVWRHTAARGGTIPIRNTTELAEITTPHQGMTISRLDLPGRPVFEWDGTRWAAPALGFLGSATNAGNTTTGTSQNTLVSATVDLLPGRRIQLTAKALARPDTAAQYVEYSIWAGALQLEPFVKRLSGVELGESLEFTAPHGSGVGGSTTFHLKCKLIDTGAPTALIKSNAFAVKLSVSDDGNG